MESKKNLEIDFKGKVCRFSLSAIDRRVLYGGRRRIAVDENGDECRSALLTKDGRFLLPSGSTANLYVNDIGDAVKRSELTAVDIEGNRLPELIASDNAAENICESVAEEELLNKVAYKVYSLSPLSLVPDLESSLNAGEIYRFPFRSGKSSTEKDAFLLANANGIFLLVCRPCRFEFVSLDQPLLDWDEVKDDIADELSFDFDFDLAGER